MKQKIRQQIKKRKISIKLDQKNKCRNLHANYETDVFKASKMSAFIWHFLAKLNWRNNSDLSKTGKNIFVPIYKENKKLCFMAEWLKNSDLKNGKWGVLEPEISRPASADEIDLMIVPGVAFDTKCSRLGRGGGYYDRMLEKSNSYKIGAAFQFQIFKKLQSEQHDISMDLIVTEQNLYIHTEQFT